MTGRKVKKPAKAPDSITDEELQDAIKAVSEQRLYYALSKEIHELKEFVHECQK